MEKENTDTIVQLEKVLLKKFLKGDNASVRYELNRLTAPGENYGSTMWSVKIFIKNTTSNDKEQVIYAVGKMVPNNEFLQKVFDSPITFRKELEFYRTIIPTVQAFQLKQGMQNPTFDCFPLFYGGRMGLKEDFDQQAIILLENLKVSGYSTADRMVGFDLKTSKAIIKHLAVFHAAPLALKLTDSEQFNEKIRPYLSRRETNHEENVKFLESALKKVKEIIKEFPNLQKLSDRIDDAFKLALSNFNKDLEEINESYATILHSDFWVNNIMIKSDPNDLEKTKVKIVDLQILSYGSPFKDLLFFLLCSVQNEVIKNHFDDFVEFYYKELIRNLNEMKINTSAYKFKDFLVEMEAVAKKSVLVQASFMLKPIFMPPGSLNSMEEISEETMTSGVKEGREHKEKLNIILSEYIKRNWI